MAKYLDLPGLRTFWSKIKITFGATLSHSETATTASVGLKNAADSPLTLSTAIIPAATTSKAGVMTADDKTKLDGIATGAEVNVQADWNVIDPSSDAFIKNKPNIPEGVAVDTAMSDSSTNAVQNKIIKAYVDGKEVKVAAGSNVQIADGSGAQAGFKVISATDTTYVFNTAYDASSNKAATMSDINSALTGAAKYQGTITSETAFVALTNYKPGYYWVATSSFVHTLSDSTTITIDAGDMIFARTERASYSAADFDIISVDIESIPDSEINDLD